jgi:NitT/TauT family transport system substrate-binding protein
VTQGTAQHVDRRPPPSGEARVATSFSTALLILMCACASEPASREAANTAVRDTVRVGYQRYITFAPLFIAEAEGFFAQERIALELTVMPDGGAGTPLIVAGRLDVLAGPGTPGLLNAIARGANARIVADKGSIPMRGCSQLALIGRSGIDLAARSGPGRIRRISPSRATHVFEYFVERALAEAGLDTTSLEVLHLPTSMLASALADGSVDAVATTEPAVARLVAAGNHVLRDASDVVPGLPYGFLVFGERLLGPDRDVGERFMVAWLRGIRQYANGLTPRNLQIVADATDEDPTVLQSACWAPFREADIDTQAYDAFQQWAVRRGLIERVLGHGEYWDGSFVANAATRLERR